MSSIGKDLITIRKHLGFTIQDIQNATKIPLNTLQAIESGAIFDQSEEIKTYVRSFVRSYGRAIKLNDEIVVSALDQQEAGNYNHLLLQQFPELEGEKKTTFEEKSDIPSKSDNRKTDEQTKDWEEKSSKFIADFPEDEPEEKTEFKPVPPPGVRSVNWADLGKRFSSQTPKTPVWIIGAVVVILIALVVVYFLFQNNFFINNDLQIEQPPASEERIDPGSNGSELSLGLTNTPADSDDVLPDTLFLTVYAAYNQLEPVRVWSDLKPRIDPYWIESGVALNYEFSDTIRVRGQYSRMLLFVNGHRIENFRQQYFNNAQNAVELTRDLFEADPKWTTPIPFDLPANAQEPDSVANRPTF